jgi:hypothetical protein
MLAITCDNATNNDVLTDQLKEKVPMFGGEASHMWCFVHVINLVAKSVITQFDLPHKCTQTAGRATELDEGGSDANTVVDSSLAGGDEEIEKMLTDLHDLASDLGDEMNRETEEVPPDEREADNDDGWINEQWRMSNDNMKRLANDMMPARRMLVKVCEHL